MPPRSLPAERCLNPHQLCRLFQVLNLINQWDRLHTAKAQLYTLLVLAAAALGFASTVALPPRFYLRHRCAAAAGGGAARAAHMRTF